MLGLTVQCRLQPRDQVVTDYDRLFRVPKLTENDALVDEGSYDGQRSCDGVGRRDRLATIVRRAG